MQSYLTVECKTSISTSLFTSTFCTFWSENHAVMLWRHVYPYTLVSWDADENHHQLIILQISTPRHFLVVTATGIGLGFGWKPSHTMMSWSKIISSAILSSLSSGCFWWKQNLMYGQSSVWMVPHVVWNCIYIYIYISNKIRNLFASWSEG